MNKLILLFISLFLISFATAYADMEKKSCYIDNGPGFENKMNKGSVSGHGHDMMTVQHSVTGKHVMMKKMEKHRDVIEKEYKGADNDLFDDFL